jgi:monovalent cation:H+ antiporter-2, CPA2 family
MHNDYRILFTLTAGLSAALVLGFITQRMRLSPILGYLLAGILLGPATPGLVVDRNAAHEFSEIGVILLMFGVGLHFKLEDLLAVRKVCLPGAFVTIFTATLCGFAAVVLNGGGWAAGLVTGIAVSVASTVMLTRVLTDNDVLHSPQGHIAFGWLIVEDLFTVFVLVLLPSLATVLSGSDQSAASMLTAIGLATVRIALLVTLVLGAGRRVIPWLLGHVARTRTRELFTLTVLVLALAIAAGSYFAFGVSMALGAFLAGMVVGQSEVSHQAAADALPMQDAFAVLFFVSVGALFDPSAVRNQPGLFVSLLAVIVLAKPVAAMVIVWLLRYSPTTSLTVAFGIAEIGEFSFIVADLATRLKLMTEEHRSVIVACAIVTITLNPLLFRSIRPLERWLKKQRPGLWAALSRRSESHVAVRGIETMVVDEGDAEKSRAIIIGYGPVGRTAASILKDFGVVPVIVDLNVDTVQSLLARGETAIYGDASHRDILRAAGVGRAKYLLITIPDLSTRTLIVIAARELNPELKIFVRARYVAERAWLEEIGVTEVAYEEAEAACGLGSLLLHEVGATDEQIDAEMDRIRRSFAVHPGQSISGS